MHQEGSRQDRSCQKKTGAAMSYLSIENEIAKCNKCGLHLERNKAVCSRGSILAKVLIIGEAPGEAEARTGQPFMGRAGKLLNRMLSYIGLDKGEYLITNIVKCRPSANIGGKVKNRTPTVDERASCLPWLIQQIEALPRVKYLFFLGKQSATAINSPAVKELIIRKHLTVVKAYHPAYYLHKHAPDEVWQREWNQVRENLDLKRKKDVTLDDF